MNFFEQIAGLKVNGNLLLNIHRDDKDYLTVSVSLTNSVGLPPLLFEGMPHELDAGFLAALAEPIQQTRGLLTNLASYNKELEKAKKTATASKTPVAKKAATEEEPENDEDDNNLFSPQPDEKQLKAERKRLYDDQMQKVKTLAQQMKYAEALAQLPDPAEHPDQEKLIVAKRQEVQAAKDIYDKLQAGFND